MRIRLAVTIIAVSVLMLAVSAFAHHATASYNMTESSTVKGTVTNFEWTNPHCQIHFDVTSDKGEVQHWNVEAPPPSMLAPRQWTRKSLQAGDVVTVYFHAAKNGSPFGIIQKVVFADGKVLNAYPDRPEDSKGGSTESSD